MFKKTCGHLVSSAQREMERDRCATHVVTSQHADDFPVAVELHEEALFHVLRWG